MSDETADNVVPIREPSEVDKTNALMNEYTKYVAGCTAPAPGAIMAMVAIQGIQLEVMLQMLAERQIDAKEYNRRIRLACKARLKKLHEMMQQPTIVIAKDLRPKNP